MTTSEATVPTKLVELHELSLEELLRLDRTALVESLLRVRRYADADHHQHVSRFNSAI